MGPIKTTVLLKGGYMGFHVSLGECKFLKFSCAPPTKGASFLSSLRFAHFVAGFDIFDTFNNGSSQMFRFRV